MKTTTNCPFCLEEFTGKDVYWIIVPFNEITCRKCGRTFNVKWYMLILAQLTWVLIMLVFMIGIPKLLFQRTEVAWLRNTALILTSIVGVLAGFTAYKNIILRWLRRSFNG